MLISYKNGQGSVVLRVLIRDSSVTTGAGLTGLTSASSGLRISTIADNEATATAYTVAGSTIETIATLGTYAAPTATKCRFKEVDATGHPGVYEIQIADARFAVSNAKSLLVSITGATNAAPCHALIPLSSIDPYDAVRAGLTALPNAAAEASGGLITRGAGTGQLSVSSGRALADLDTIKTQAVTCAAGVTFLASVGTASVSTAQTGDAYPNSQTLVSRLTSGRASALDYLDVAISSRLAGSAYTAPPSAATIGTAVWSDATGAVVKASTDKIPANPAAVGSAMQLDLSQVVSPVDVSGLTTMTVGQCFAAARAGTAGAESIVSTTYLIKNPDGSTFRSFTLDSATNPTSRT